MAQAQQPPLPAIPEDSNKYSRGSLLLLAGSGRYPGAAVLATQAAERAGAGYVTLATPQAAVQAVRAQLLSAPVLAAAEQGVGEEAAFSSTALPAILARQRHIDAIVAGPGMLATPGTASFVGSVIQFSAGSKTPLLLDADGLNALAALAPCPKLPLGTILTPHAGELARLCTAFGVCGAEGLAEKSQAIIIAKGPETHIFSAEAGELRRASMRCGTPALAKAGTGDVLAGVIGSLLAQGMPAWEASVAGVAIHGAAGRLAEAQLGTRSVCAPDVITFLPEAIRGYSSRPSQQTAINMH